MAYCLIVALALSACNGSKAYYKKGFKLEEAGLNEEAVKMYLTSLAKKNSNVDAQIQLKALGQKVLDERWADFYIAHQAGDHKKAVYSYQEADALNAQVNRYVRIDKPPYYEEYFAKSKEDYLDEIYGEAQELLANEHFEESNELFSEIARFDPSYKDVHDMKKTSETEPLYRKAEEAMKNDEFRSAYYLYDEVIDVAGSYKDSKTRKAEALDKASFTIAIMPLEGAGQSAQLTNKFYSLITQELIELNSPFIKVIDRSLTDQILAEQKLALSGLVEENTAAEAGKLIGSKAVLSGSIINMKVEQNSPRAQEMKGYEAYKVRRINPQTKKPYYVTQYKKVTYKEYTGSLRVTSSFQFKLVSSSTGEVLVSDVVMREALDLLNYATYSGNHSDLFPGYWKHRKLPTEQDKVFVDQSRKRVLMNKLKNTRRILRSEDSMKLELMQAISADIAGLIKNHEESRD